MKSRIIYILLSVCALLVSCQQGDEMFIDNDLAGKTISINVTAGVGMLEGSAQTKATLEDMVRFTWTKGDKVTMVDLATGSRLGTLTAAFSGTTTS
ncbi:MAG: hypothetical protein MJZ16_12870, partial [Bacteroidales bacterium]|nr:hypothetical protein [Bacteroidales bacterium]